MNTTKHSWPDFATREPNTGKDWGNFQNEAFAERCKQYKWFQDWIINKRPEVELSLWRAERNAAQCEPFARAAQECARIPQEIPLAANEYAMHMLQVQELRRELKLLNVLYFQIYGGEGEGEFWADTNNRDEIMRLWEWFLAEHKSDFQSGYTRQQNNEEIPAEGWHKIGGIWPKSGTQCVLANATHRFPRIVEYLGERGWIAWKPSQEICPKGDQVDAGDGQIYTHWKIAKDELPGGAGHGH